MIGGWPIVATVALAVGVVSLAWSSIPQFDPSGWLLWGRAPFSSSLTFTTVGYPSWKPLPALFSVPLALSGSAAPALWLIIVRLATVVLGTLVFRLGRQAGGAAAAVSLLEAG